MLETSPFVILLFFVNDLGFLAFSSLIEKIVKALKKIAKEVIAWGMLNRITYNMSKIKAMFFSKLY